MNTNEQEFSVNDFMAEVLSKGLESVGKPSKPAAKKPDMSCFDDPMGYDFDFINPMGLEGEVADIRNKLSGRLTDKKYIDMLMSNPNAKFELSSVMRHEDVLVAARMLHELILMHVRTELERVASHLAWCEAHELEPQKKKVA